MGASVSGFIAAAVGWTWFFPIAAATTLVGALFYVGYFNRIETLVVEREHQEIELVENE